MTTPFQRPPFFASLDVVEADDAFHVFLDLPGFQESEIQVRLRNNRLHIQGDRVLPSLVKGSAYLKGERAAGHFARELVLPHHINAHKITATLDHGILSVTIPKSIQPRLLQDVPVYQRSDEGDGSLNYFFKKIALNTFPSPPLGKIVTINSDMSIYEATQVLSKHRILAAPVVDVTQPADAPWSQKYLGIVDMVGIVFNMIGHLEPGGKPLASLSDEIHACEQFKTTKVSEAVSFSRFGPFVPLDHEKDNFLDVMFLCGVHNLHRVPIVKFGGELMNIITQSRVLYVLSKHLAELSDVTKKSLADLGLASKREVVCINKKETLRAGFHLLKESEVSGLAVVDDGGAIVGNLSARDARFLITSTEMAGMLHLPLTHYLSVMTAGFEHAAVTCSPKDSLEYVIQHLIKNQMHRIYVVDENNVPIRVLSLRNILMKFVKEPSGYFGKFFDGV